MKTWIPLTAVCLLAGAVVAGWRLCLANSPADSAGSPTIGGTAQTLKRGEQHRTDQRCGRFVVEN